MVYIQVASEVAVDAGYLGIGPMRRDVEDLWVNHQIHPIHQSRL